MSDKGGRAALVVGAGILLSRITGLLRQTAFAHFLGSGTESDAYVAALRIPGAVRNLLGEGTLSAAFVPVYSRMLAKSDTRAARALAGAVLGLLMLVVSVLTLVGIAVAPWLTVLLASGFSAETQELTTRLSRVLFPMAGLMVLSGWCLGIQNSHRRFFWSYASAALWSIAQIVLLAGFGNRAADKVQLVWWLSWATLAGSVLQIMVQLPEVIRLVGPIRPTFNRAAEGVTQTMRNIGPVIAALGAVQISSFIDLGIASYLVAGSTSNLNYASILAMLPVSLFGVSVASSSLPEFSRETAGQSLDSLRDRLRAGWQRILFYIVPSAVVFVAFGDLCIGMLYRTGQFGASEQQIVHAVLAAFAVGLISYSSVKLLASAHYALQNYRGPLRASLASIVVSATAAAAMAFAFRSSRYGVVAIALGSAMGSYVNLVLLLRGLRPQLGAMYTPAMWTGTWRIVAAVTIALIVTAPLRWWLRDAIPWVAGPPALLLFAFAYLFAAWAMGSGEAARWLRLPPRVRRPTE